MVPTFETGGTWQKLAPSGGGTDGTGDWKTDGQDGTAKYPLSQWPPERTQ